MEILWQEKFLVAALILAASMAGLSFVLPFLNNFSPAVSVKNNVATANVNQAPLPPPPQKLANPPLIIKSIYITGYSAGSKTYLNYLTGLFKNTQVNAVVIDIKGSDGYVTYNSAVPDVQKYKLSDFAIGDIDSLIRFLHSQNIYVIGRIAVFEDPEYSKARPELAIYNKEKTSDLSQPILWKDNNGLSWMDPASKDFWDYDVSLAKDATSNHGFDEINFDYVRFPTDGARENMGFPVYDGKTPMSDVIDNFFQYLRASLPNDKISADLFGLTTVSTGDMGIGQLIENAFKNFDYVCPMVYPSHYANGFIGFANPADHPYEVIKYSLDGAVAKENTLDLLATTSPSDAIQAPVAATIPLGKLRPWLQDFNMGAFYTADMIDLEIKATQDSLGSNYDGFMLWNPSNVYTQGALLKSN